MTTNQQAVEWAKNPDGSWRFPMLSVVCNRCLGIYNWCTNCHGQTRIAISTDSQAVGAYLQAIRSASAKLYILTFYADKVTWVPDWWHQSYYHYVTLDPDKPAQALRELLTLALEGEKR